MSNILIVGYMTEGPTDVRFLDNIIKRTFEEISLECDSDIEIYSVQNISVVAGSFIEKVRTAVAEADKRGVMVMCIHSDADDKSDEATFRDRINPAFEAILNDENLLCKNLVPIVPITMTEAWMLADNALFKDELSTTLRDIDLGIHRDPQTVSDPKRTIVEAIRAAHGSGNNRRKEINIGELYQPMGQKICLTKLNTLSSFDKFKTAVRNSLKKMNYLHD